MGEYAVSRHHWLKERNYHVCVSNTRIPDMEYNGVLSFTIDTNLKIFRFFFFFFFCEWKVGVVAEICLQKKNHMTVVTSSNFS